MHKFESYFSGECQNIVLVLNPADQLIPVGQAVSVEYNYIYSAVIATLRSSVVRCMSVKYLPCNILKWRGIWRWMVGRSLLLMANFMQCNNGCSDLTTQKWYKRGQSRD